MTKKEHIVETSKLLFIKYGIKRISVEEICEKVPVSKGTFYKYFHNKYHLVKVLLRHIVDESYQLMDTIFKQHIPFHQKIKEYIDLRITRSREFGSLFIDDMNTFDDELKEFMEQIQLEGYRKMVGILHTGQKEGAIRADLSSEMFMLVFDNMLELFNSGSLKDIIPDSQKRLIEITKLMFYGITGK